jgi:hypothetical protein
VLLSISVDAGRNAHQTSPHKVRACLASAVFPSGLRIQMRGARVEEFEMALLQPRSQPLKAVAN